MTALVTTKERGSKGEERRQAILAAALQCFRTSGFNGAGIAMICKAAGISPGHLYHFFDTKEAMIEAIVEGDRVHMLELVASLASSEDPLESLMEGFTTAAEGRFTFSLDPVLTAEIIAEATRNPRVASILVKFDASSREAVANVIKLSQEAGQIDKQVDNSKAATALLLLMDGILSRQISDPSFEPATMRPMLQAMIRSCLAASPDE